MLYSCHDKYRPWKACANWNQPAGRQRLSSSRKNARKSCQPCGNINDTHIFLRYMTIHTYIHTYIYIYIYIERDVLVVHHIDIYLFIFDGTLSTILKRCGSIYFYLCRLLAMSWLSMCVPVDASIRFLYLRLSQHYRKD